jgi:hypothetical protein
MGLVRIINDPLQEKVQDRILGGIQVIDTLLSTIQSRSDMGDLVQELENV